jgi:hypothetical protein
MYNYGNNSGGIALQVTKLEIEFVVDQEKLVQ